ncbi:MAG TPA: NrpR regulatory domain-containing protein [Planctomycetota bacterium]|nr:NrpR regulatory domain-containing protein [Planctomycetota bacterium]
MDARAKRRAASILRALRDAGRPLGASRLARDLEAMGIDMSQRTVRYYLAMLDQAGMTRSCGKKGREITPLGQQEVANSFVAEKVGFIAAKMDELACQMTFQARRRCGTIIINYSTIPADHIARAVAEMTVVFEADLGMGRFVAVARPGETLGRYTAPEGQFAVGTVCSVSINGILLSEGIPAASRFAGLLEVSGGQPARFTEMIHYDGTSLDPLEVFISGRMTTVREAARTGQGVIGASFREIPAVAVPRVRKVCARLAQIGLGGILLVGKPNRPLLEIPVPEGRAGLVVVGGLNPLAAVEEAGIPTRNRALTGLFEFERLTSFRELGALVGGAAV